MLKKFTPLNLKSRRGFTLIEAVAVLVILGVLAAVAVPRTTNISQEARVQADLNALKASMRYAQYLAFNDIHPFRWGIEVGASSYELVRYNFDGTPTKLSHTLNLPGSSSASRSFNSGVSATPQNVYFDEWGSPGTTTISVTLNGKSADITADTGFMP